MKRILLFGLTAASITLAEAAMPLMKTSNDDVLSKAGKGVHEKGNTVIFNRTPNGRTIQKKASAGNEGNSYLLYENFNGWDGKNLKWIPEGWNIEHNGECSMEYTWSPIEPTAYYPTIHDGKYCFCISFSDKQQDEWLISPEFTPKKNMELSYYMINRPLYFYSMKNLDWTTKEYQGDKIVDFTLQVLIKEDGEDWHLLRDHAEDYKDCSYKELRDACNLAYLEKQTIDLSEYADKEVKVAFRYLGIDGDLMMLDAIGVGYPLLDAVLYKEPANALYWGFSTDAYFIQNPVDIAFYPANTEISWSNISEEETASYSWQYDSQNAPGFIANENEDHLTLTYAGETQGAFPKLYESPILSAIAPERIDGVYQSPVKYFQTGGKPTFTDEEGTLEFTLFQFPMISQDLAFKSVMDDRLGAYSVPVYGYNEFSNDYWLNYTLDGEEPTEGDYSHLIGIGNLYYASHDVPLIVNGISVFGWGRIWNEAELTATIYALDSEMNTDYDTYTAIARATLKGEDVLSLDDFGSKDYIYLPFKFNEPVKVQASSEHPAFMFMIEGFNSDKIDYFAPLHNYLPSNTGVSAGYMLHEINIQGSDKGTYRVLSDPHYSENGTFYSEPVTFAIGLDAEYPVDSSSVSTVEAPEKQIEGIYDLNGVKVASFANEGIYIVKYSDGSVKKIVK
ncbi:MAG: choice-of-anchor J domain-containing protein [Muribaculaceae bacterium]|nr:choice-of-anchor J domain-containing protein [Muribaculaceae bacterium]